METSALPAPLAAALLDAGYRVGGPAGVGGGGPVWTATRVAGDSGAPERVVVQVLDVPDDAARARLAGRLEALWALDHPHLPTVVDVVVVPSGGPGGEVWAVLLEEVPGATVAALLAARGRLSTAEVVTLTVPIAGALDGLHRSGLVHGDVSPANVVVRPDGRPVLIDVLGAELDVPGDDAAGRAHDRRRGTPGFMAPEVSRTPLAAAGRSGRPGPTASLGARVDGLAAGAPADVFALAGVALAALDLAEHGGRLGDELRAATAGEPVRRPTAAELAAAVYACAEPAPIVQPDAGVLARAALAQLAAPARTVSVPTGGRHRARRARWAPWGGAPGTSVRTRWLAAGALVVAGAVPGVAWAVVAGSGPGTDPAPREAGAAAASVRTAPGTSTTSPAGPAAPPPGAAPGTPSDGARDVRSDDPVTTGAPAAGRPDPVDAAVALTRRRAEVLASGDARGLVAVTSPGTPADLADRALLDRLAAGGVTLEGLAVVVEDAELVPPPAGATADVRVRSSLTAHTRRSPSGDVGVPAQPARVVVLRLAWTDAGWRVTDVRPA